MCALVGPAVTSVPRRGSPQLVNAIVSDAEPVPYFAQSLQHAWGSTHYVALFACALGAHRSRRRVQSSVQRQARDWRGINKNMTVDEDMVLELQKRSKLRPKPMRLPDVRGLPPPGAPGGITDEQIEDIIDEMVPKDPRRHFDPHKDNPLEEGLNIWTKPGQLENTICCRGCGIPLQTHDPTNVGYVRFQAYLQKWSQRLQRKILCNRCSDLGRGLLKPVVRETLGQDLPEDTSQIGFGGHVVPADVLARQLKTIRDRRCLVVYVLDVLDLNGSFVRNLRAMIGKNPVVVVGTKIDLLPRRTDFDELEGWLRRALRKRSLRVLDVKLVSNFTGKGIDQAVTCMLDHRRSTDVFVVGAANAGKSMFINRMLDNMERRFPQGKVDEVMRPIVSTTPGTTLGIMPLRAFRRHAESTVFASLYDTPGVHQADSMQNLLPIEVYNRVQPTRPFDVKTKRPAMDVVAALRASGERVTAEAAEAWLRAPVRYLWGPPNADPVAVVEVLPPVSSMLQLSFVGVEGLQVRCESGRSLGIDSPEGIPPPEGLSIARVCYLDVPEEISHEGDVMCDVAISGFGWVAVTASPLAGAAGRQSQSSKFTLKVYGPPRLKVKIAPFAIPICGLPGRVPDLEEQDKGDGYDLSFDDEQLEQDDTQELDDIDPEEMEDMEEAASSLFVEPPRENTTGSFEDGTFRRRPRDDAYADGDDADFDQNYLQSMFDRELNDDILPDDDFEEYDPFDDGFGSTLAEPGSSAPRMQQGRQPRGGGPARREQPGRPYAEERDFGASPSGSRGSARPSRRPYEEERDYDASSSGSMRSARPGRPKQKGRDAKDVGQKRSAPRKPQQSSAAAAGGIGRGAGGRGGLVRRIRK